MLHRYVSINAAALAEEAMESGIQDNFAVGNRKMKLKNEIYTKSYISDMQEWSISPGTQARSPRIPHFFVC